ncbi:hypothetical protein, partial [Kitasatospora kazusensis]|uniref:hypothetical protein n=1 Tax=Kitasatospora kazusensis TaxID=407974 RepID=UPI0031E2EE91
LVDAIEAYGRAVAAGETDREQAAAAIVEAGRGAIAPLSAEELITNWRTARQRHEPGQQGDH